MAQASRPVQLFGHGHPLNLQQSAEPAVIRQMNVGGQKTRHNLRVGIARNTILREHRTGLVRPSRRPSRFRHVQEGHVMPENVASEVMTYKSFSESPHYIMEVGKHKSKPLIFCQEFIPEKKPEQNACEPAKIRGLSERKTWRFCEKETKSKKVPIERERDVFGKAGQPGEGGEKVANAEWFWRRPPGKDLQATGTLVRPTCRYSADRKWHYKSTKNRLADQTSTYRPINPQIDRWTTDKRTDCPTQAHTHDFNFGEGGWGRHKQDQNYFQFGYPEIGYQLRFGPKFRRVYVRFETAGFELFTSEFSKVPMLREKTMMARSSYSPYLFLLRLRASIIRNQTTSSWDNFTWNPILNNFRPWPPKIFRNSFTDM
ncbi:unnamed protein product [Nesidiocoris tenuis]|uniref:Uncharacterized protein n=1 Tax=Nesidiocoris tenuis TaxID=355587 RepID=A0A6H5GII5_9HEMI|nr:unnamed protein product [Nesidiocoris tenuis]